MVFPTQDIQITLFDRSASARECRAVFFHRDMTVDFDPVTVAWKVIPLTSQSVEHPFIYPAASCVTARDSYGNHMPRLSASPGELYHVKNSPSGHELWLKGPATSDREIQVENDLDQGYIDAFIFKADRPMAVKTSIAPQQKAVFQIRSELFVGLTSQAVAEGGSLPEMDVVQAILLTGLLSIRVVLDRSKAGAPGVISLEDEVRA